jgi:CDP-6-deoxy-D-xylo-4-hexulose-3-dehydrase
MVMFNNLEHRNVSLQFRDWGRIGDNSEVMSDRFNHIVDGIPYDYKFLYGVLGYNFKSSEMNAAFGLVQLQRFETFKQIRRDNIERYLKNLEDCEELILPNDSIKPNWLAIPLQYNNRYELLKFLEDNNIQTRVTFAGNITRHPIYRQYLQEFPNADVDYVCDKIKEFIVKNHV